MFQLECIFKCMNKFTHLLIKTTGVITLNGRESNFPCSENLIKDDIDQVQN